MNVLFVSIAWPSPSERNLYSDLMDEFTANGHKIFVVSGSESDDAGNHGPVVENGIIVLRINSGKIRKTSYMRKSLSLLTLGIKISAAIHKHIPETKFDLLISHTPPISLSSLFGRLKRKHHAPFYLLLKDIWPQGSVDHGVFRKFSLPWVYLRWHEKRIYMTADRIGCMSPLGVEYILTKNTFLEEKKVEVCPNSIRPTREFPNLNHSEIRQRYGIPDNACVFIFSGNLSKGHGLGFLVDAVRNLSDYPKAFFLIGGSGTHYNFLESSLRNYTGGNVFLYRRLPSEDFKLIMQTSDVGLILLDKCYTVPQFPSRLLSYLDYSKPVLCAVNEGTDIGSIIENNHCGQSVIHGDMNSFIDAVRFFSENPADRFLMGKNGRTLLEREYNASVGYQTIMRSYAKIIEE
jgi:glycosyltransferase involved in cell wall biosynthesis